MKLRFLYHDKAESQQTIHGYKAGTYIHENDHVTASTLRGGLLKGCNLRYLFYTSFSGEDTLVNDDYKRQGLYIFDHTLYYNIYDNYKVGSYTQVLLSPDNDLPDWFVEMMIEQARVDFNQLINTRPVPVLDTQEWRRRLGSEPIGKNGKTPDHKLKNR